MRLEIVKYTSGAIGLEIVGETVFETKVLDAHWDGIKPSRGKGESVAEGGYTMGFFLNLIDEPVDD